MGGEQSCPVNQVVELQGSRYSCFCSQIAGTVDCANTFGCFVVLFCFVIVVGFLFVFPDGVYVDILEPILQNQLASNSICLLTFCFLN